MDWWRWCLIAAALIASGIGTIAWWRWRRDVTRLLREILAELRGRS